MNKPHTASIRLPALAPRNPVAPMARARRAGAHRPQGGALRRRHRDALRRELLALPPPGP